MEDEAHNNQLRQPLAGVSIRRLVSYTLPLTQPMPDGGRILGAAGEAAQIVSGEAFRYLAYLEFLPAAGVARGNHYHLQKHEYLYVLQGHLRAWYHDIDSGQAAEVEIATGDLVQTPPRTAHAYLPLAYSQAVEFAATPFDAADSYRYILYAAQ
jgi:mannose-6-phosphate isomerase-like protein (cupin superfamily)